jgi:hypothetical protein
MLVLSRQIAGIPLSSTTLTQTTAGNSCISGSTQQLDGIGTNAALGLVFASAIDVSGNLFIGDTGTSQTNSWLRKVIVSTKTVSTLYTYTSPVGAYDGQSFCSGMAVDNSGALYFADTAPGGSGTGWGVWRLRYGSGSTTPVVIAGCAGYCSIGGSCDGVGAAASFSSQLGRMVLDSSGHFLYIVDIGLRKYDRISQHVFNQV